MMKSLLTAGQPISPRRKLWIVTGVLGAGLLLAIPFRQSTPGLTNSDAGARAGREVHGDGSVSLSIGPAADPAGPGPLSDSIAPGEFAQVQPSDLAGGRPVVHAPIDASPPSMDERYSSLLDGESMRIDRSPAERSGQATGTSGTEAIVGHSQPYRVHRLRDGDRLVDLAIRYLSDPDRAGEILELNRDILEDPEILPLGRQIRIPAR